MSLTRKYLTYVEALQSAFDTLHFFQCIHLKSCRRQSVAHLLRCEVEVNVFLQPFIGNIHSTLYLRFLNSGAKLQKKS